MDNIYAIYDSAAIVDLLLTVMLEAGVYFSSFIICKTVILFLLGLSGLIRTYRTRLSNKPDRSTAFHTFCRCGRRLRTLLPEHHTNIHTEEKSEFFLVTKQRRQNLIRRRGCGCQSGDDTIRETDADYNARFLLQRCERR